MVLPLGLHGVLTCGPMGPRRVPTSLSGATGRAALRAMERMISSLMEPIRAQTSAFQKLLS